MNYVHPVIVHYVDKQILDKMLEERLGRQIHRFLEHSYMFMCMFILIKLVIVY